MSPDDFRRLVSAGLNTDQIALVMEMIEAKDSAHAAAEEARKSKGRERVAKWRSGRNVTVTQQKVTEPLVRERDARVSDKLKPIDNNIPKNSTSKDLSDFRDALASLGADRLDALIKVRKAKRAPINGYAANLFSKAASTCQISIAEAADMCIERNWLTVKPDWIAKPVARGSPAAGNGQPRNIFEASTQLLNEMKAAENDTRPDQIDSRPQPPLRHITAAER